MAGEMATVADGTNPTGIHSCYKSDWMVSKNLWMYPVCYLRNGLGNPFETIQMPQGSIYTTILFSLKTKESLQNEFATHFQTSPLISTKAESLASSQSCCRVDADAWCK